MTIIDVARRAGRGLRRTAATTRRRLAVEDFHRHYYYGDTWLGHTHWMGRQIQKCPLDLWQYQEMLHDLRPDLVIETGTAHGGSALYLAHVMDLVGNGRVVTVDVNRPADPPHHDRITYLRGSSTDPAVVARVREAARDAATVLVVLDSDHSRDHVRDELAAYADFVTVGSYLVVEDSNVNGHPVDRAHGPGPMEALEEFLARRRDFEVDRARERFLMTFNPSGYLRRIS